MLHLVFSAGKTAEEILLKFRKTSEEKKEALEKLVRMSGDVTFAQEFIRRQVSEAAGLMIGFISLLIP